MARSTLTGSGRPDDQRFAAVYGRPPRTAAERKEATSLAHPKSQPTIKGQSGRSLGVGRTSSEDSSPAATGGPIKVTRNAKPLAHPLSTPKVRGSTSTSGRSDLGPSTSSGSLGPMPRPKDMPTMGSLRPKARPKRPAGGTARGEDLGPSTSAGTTNAKGPKPRPASFTDRAKVKAAKTKAAAVTGTPPKPRPKSADGKGKGGGLLDALRRNTDNQRLAKERQKKAGRKN